MGQTDARAHKLCAPDAAIPTERASAGSTTLFLARGTDHPRTNSNASDTASRLPNLVSTLQELIDDGPARSKPQVIAGQERQRSISRRRSTIKAARSTEKLRRDSTADLAAPSVACLNRSTTASPLVSRCASFPGSPESLSSRSIQRSDDELINDDNASQAIGSSEEDEQDEEHLAVRDSQPELIMPSIKMPSRRPFTRRGAHLARFKILVAGQKGSGKTSLIKSIVQVCEDIVHVDPLLTVPTSSAAAGRQSWHGPSRPLLATTEIYASTKSYPTWWSDLDESGILRRRKSMGDAVLERNLCFVDMSSSKLDHIIHYAENQLGQAISSACQGNHDFAGLLSGRGGSQVDVILYLVSKESAKVDQDYIRQLSQLSNVIPLIAQSDLLTEEEQRALKQDIDVSTCCFPKLPAFPSSPEQSVVTATAPYTVTSVNGPDLDTMDASLLMSPEYVQPLMHSELGLVVDQIFEPNNVAYLKHTAAKRLLAWHAAHPKLMRMPSPSLPSVHNSTLASPLPTSLSNSGVLIPQSSELSLNMSNSFALARVADHAQREERLAQIRLSKWASELQLSLQRERERYERLARGERAVWLVARMGEEVRRGQIVPFGQANAALARHEMGESKTFNNDTVYQMHDPLGLLQWQDTLRARGWITLQVVGSFGVVGGLAFWMAKTMGLTSSLPEWATHWSQQCLGMGTEP
ncbi:hypothetical protein DV736_g6026, partial [Chaetothyriales sp. CBS 134916]